jgi:hypothetical protein
MATSWMNQGMGGGGNRPGWLNTGMGNTRSWMDTGMGPTTSWMNSGMGNTVRDNSRAGYNQNELFAMNAARNPPDPYAGLMAALGAQPSYNVGNRPADVPVGPVFSQADTDQATGGIMANAQQNADLRSLAEQFMRPGVSQGSGQLSAAIPQSVGAMSRGIGAAQNLALSNRVANANQIFQGENANAQNAMGWGNVQSGLDTMGRNQRYFNQQQLLSLLGA